MKEILTRRDFLKLAGLTSLGIAAPYFELGIKNFTNQDNPKNVLIIVFDALSAYHLSVHGYDRETMPNLTRLADKAVVYNNHYSGGNYTTPGTATILTGTLPWTHRAILHNDTVAPEFVNKNLFSVFPEYFRMAYSHNILVNTQLKQFFVDIDDYTSRSRLFLGDSFKVDRNFSNDEDIASVSLVRALKQADDGYAYSLFLSRINDIMKENQIKDLISEYPRGLPYINIDNYYVLEQGIDFLTHQVSRVPRPFLGYYHFLPPHEPYNPRKEFIGSFQGDQHEIIEKGEHVFSMGKSIEKLNKLSTDYDEFILNVDYEFSRLYNYLDKLGITNDTWIVLTSDHGELFERGIVGHSTPILHQPVIRVPLFIFEPGRTSRLDIFEPTSGMDILPTLLHISGKTVPGWIEGKVLPPFTPVKLDQIRDLYALQAKGSEKNDPIIKATVMLVYDRYKLLYYFGYKELKDSGQLIELYDLENDPNELNNLYPDKKMMGDDLVAKIKDKLAEVNQPYL
jgi:arylsulfatase A-like enzyme